MKTLKKILCILIIVAIIILIVLICFSKSDKNNKDNIKYNENVNITNSNTSHNPILENEDTYDVSLLNKIELVNNRNKYFAISNIIDTYTNNNFIINKMYITKKATNIDVFWVEGIKKDTNTLSNLIISTDSLNKVFAVINEEQIEQNAYSLNNLNSIDTNKITYNSDNKFEYKNINDEEYVKYLLKDYLIKTLYNTQLGYNSLKEEYREKKFGSFEKYNEIININRDKLALYDTKNIKQAGEFSSYEEWLLYFGRIQLLEVEKYSVKSNNNYTEYTIVDTYGNYYIFVEETVMNYKLMLDTYTIDTLEFLEKYEEVSKEEKGEMNIDKIFEAINNKDYNYVYNKLDANYKNSYFTTLESFSTFMSNNLFEKNEVEFDEYEESENSCKYSLIIKDASGQNKNQILMTMIMQLGENTDFTIKFE